MLIPKTAGIKSKKLRDSARDQACTLNIIGACNHRTDTTVLAHLPGTLPGVGAKACDLFAAYACSDCHDVLDGRAQWPTPQEREARDWYMLRGLHRTMVSLVRRGIIQKLEADHG
tara:strand:- start:390 stop:734 length:345 start_codon:yes stop_codon:yes gene_type:complete